MDDKVRRRTQLNCLYDMFRDRVEENVIYIVYTENDSKIDATIDQLMSIAACSFTGHHFEPPKPLVAATNSAKNSVGVERVQTRESLVKESSDRSETPDDTELDLEQRIENLQKSIDNLLDEKNTSHEKASQYLSKKMYPVTGYYSELASEYRRMVERKTKQLVDLLLLKSQNSDSIDLHGLKPIQARLVVQELLRIRQDKLSVDKRGEASLDIITGWGKHCVTNGQRIRPAIVSLLRENGFEYQHLNKGALRVTIRR